MIPMLCKVFGHKYSYYWICTRCGDHAGVRHVTDLVRAVIEEAKKEAAAQSETGTAHD